MFCFQLITTMWLVATSLFITAGLSAAQTPLSTNKVTTCDSLYNVQRLSCDSGVISVQSALYGRMDNETCSEGRPERQLTNTRCSQKGTLDLLKKRCDGKSVCEVNTNLVRFSDPCSGTYKYLETTYACVPAIHSVTCDGSIAYLQCDNGQMIHVIAADYGRHDKTTCSFGLTASEVQNVACTSPATKVAELCNGKSSCSVKLGPGDPCPGTYKYLEVAYCCNNPSV